MKTTVEIPDPLFREAKATAARRGQSLKQLITEALQEKLAANETTNGSAGPPWMDAFGTLRHLGDETARVQNRIDETFGTVEDEDRA